jgi:NAD(P)-dependent dehydrogenase (short-subunit alcohol dehydrogenase family)
MKVKLKPLDEQVIVITGASSGIGLTTARLAAHRGARVVLNARDEENLKQIVTQIRLEGGQATYSVGDVADEAAVRALADSAVREFGHIDTWVNNAGVSIYGRTEEVSIDDARRLFDVNYWGVVHGSLVAVEHLREHGGALINIGSIASERAIPLQGHYCASKQAIKAFTTTLRMELEKDGVPIVVSLVKPAAIDTPYPNHARNYLDSEPKHPAPVYAPSPVARAILACAARPIRDITVGGGGRFMTALGSASPRIADRYMEATMFQGQQSDRSSGPARRDSLFASPGDAPRERGDYPGHVMRTSAYTQARLHPVATLLGVAAAGVGVALAARSRNGSGDGM